MDIRKNFLTVVAKKYQDRSRRAGSGFLHWQLPRTVGKCLAGTGPSLSAGDWNRCSLQVYKTIMFSQISAS